RWRAGCSDGSDVSVDASFPSRTGCSSVPAMSQSTRPSWERFSDGMLDWGGYLLLALATLLGVSAGDPDPAWKATTLGIAAVAALWLYVGYSRWPLPNVDHRVRLDVFFVGL